ncbi:Maspardin [Blomia tropicalis]|nr:Maspardin [Blomia tropicalis]
MENSANMVDMNGNNNENPPEIQIDLVGPRTPSPVEESDLEIPSVPVKQYKFKVQYDADSMCNMEDYSADSSMDDGIIDQSVGSSELPLNQHYVAKRLSMSAIVNNNVVDVATTPELEIDLAQAQEISKHIVTEIINQAVDILNKENQNPNNCSKVAKYKDTAGSMAATGSTTIKRETESYSKISCHSSRTNASITGNCSWINRARHALSRVMHADVDDNDYHLTNRELDPKDWIENSTEYCRFRSSVALRKLALDDDNNNRVWSIHECGPREVQCPVIFLPPVSGTADIYFIQMNYLSERGHRVISLQYPTYFTIDDFCDGFQRLLDYYKVKQVHIFGASLGGFLAQKFAQYNSSVIASLFLCNSFGDTSKFKFSNTVPLIWFAPAPILRNYFVSSEIPQDADDHIRLAAQFMSRKLATLNQTELLSRLTLNLSNDYVQPDQLQSLPITIMDVFDHCANSNSTKQDLYKLYPHARRAHLKSGSNFPYLSRSDEVNIHLLVHLRQFNNTPKASCIHFMEVTSDSEINENNQSDSLESSVELGKVAEEIIVNTKSMEHNKNDDAHKQRNGENADKTNVDDMNGTDPTNFDQLV